LRAGREATRHDCQAGKGGDQERKEAAEVGNELMANGFNFLRSFLNLVPPVWTLLHKGLHKPLHKKDLNRVGVGGGGKPRVPGATVPGGKVDETPVGKSLFEGRRLDKEDLVAEHSNSIRISVH